MLTLAVILEAPEHLALRALEMKPVEAADVLVEIAWSGISTGTEKLLFTGRMPLERFKDERPLEYERLVAQGKVRLLCVDEGREL